MSKDHLEFQSQLGTPCEKESEDEVNTTGRVYHLTLKDYQLCKDIM